MAAMHAGVLAANAQAREVAFLPTRRRLGLDGNHVAAGLDHEVHFVAALLVPVGKRRMRKEASSRLR